MPNCAVITCRNRSEKCYSDNSGVSFHRFPKDPKTKEKWIDTTGRGPNWFPLKSSTVCSIHFTEKCFQNIKRGKKIFPWAVPTLKIPVITSSINVEVKLEATTHKSAKESVPQERNQVQQQVPEGSESGRCMLETPRKQKLREKIEQCQQVMKKQKTKIKSLQKKASRYRKKIGQLEDILAELKGKKIVTCDRASWKIVESKIS